jgi:branched-chain amino acid transport system permease protein
VSELEGRGVAWTEERGTSDEGRRRLQAPRKRAGNTAVADTHTAGRTATGPQRPPLRRPDARSLVRPAVIVMLLLFVLFALPQLLSLYYIGAMTQVAVYAIVALGLGVLVGRVGLVSLGQVAVLAIGAWVAARLLFATSLPYPVVLLGAGVITMVLGTLIGLPALRLRGLYLALITLMLAGGITVALATTNFPNGGSGFLGYNGSSVHIPPIRRPSIAASDPAYFRYSVLVAALMFLLVLAHIRTRPGRAWAAIRQSELTALAAGINTTLYKLWAFALASFITGVAGGVLAGAIHYLYSIDFPTQDSITLLAVVLMGGAYSLWGAVVAALLYQLLPALLNNWGVSSDWLTILFGIGVLQVLTTAPAGLADQVPKDLGRLGRLLRRRVLPGRVLPGGVPHKRLRGPSQSGGGAG